MIHVYLFNPFNTIKYIIREVIKWVKKVEKMRWEIKKLYVKFTLGGYVFYIYEL